MVYRGFFNGHNTFKCLTATYCLLWMPYVFIWQRLICKQRSFYYIQNIRKLAEWFNCACIFIRLKLIRWKWIFLVNSSWVETFSASRISLYFYLSSHLAAYLYHSFNFSRRPFAYKALSLNYWYNPIVSICFIFINTSESVL